MKELKDMDRDELFEVIRIKNIQIRELEEEIESYELLVKSLQEKIINGK